jgi:hypothetical protein
MSGIRWAKEEHVLAGPVADLLRKACAEEQEIPNGNRPRTRHFDHEKGGLQVTTSRIVWELRYAERFGVSHRTAIRHFSLVFSQPSVPVVVADRITALLGVPLAYIEAVS